MKTTRFLVLLAISLIILSLCPEKAYCFSSGYERYVHDLFEVYVEYFPIVPYDLANPTASEEFAMKFQITQNDYWDNVVIHYVPSCFGVHVFFWDECNSSSWPEWKKWYPTTTDQRGVIVSWDLSAEAGKLGISASIATGDIDHIATNFTKYPTEHEGKTYIHIGSLEVYYACNCLWGQVFAEGAGSLGIPNDVAINHAGHHIQIAIQVMLGWTGYFLTWPVATSTGACYFITGDDDPASTDCWISVQQGKTNFGIHYPYSPPGGGCPTLFAWNGTANVDYGVINIHNPTGEDIIREVPIQTQDVSINNYMAKFRLREGYPGLNFSESFIDQVKLYAVDNHGERHLCPLISATHSSLGNVLPQLLASDDYRVQTLLFETIDLTFLVPYQNIQSFTFVIEGYNPYKIWD